MHVFVTGATGWIGTPVVHQLLEAGHQVTGLARSEAAEATLQHAGARALRGDLDDLDAIRDGATAADAVVHLANKHDWTNMAATNQAERSAVHTIGKALTGSHRPFLLASGLAALPPTATEQDRSPFHGPDSNRGGSENLALSFAEDGVNTIVARFAPTVHGDGDHGFIATLIDAARSKGSAAYINEGTNQWAAVHRSDAAHLVRLALEHPLPPGTILHAVAEPGITTRAIAKAIGDGLHLPTVSVPPEQAGDYIGWLSMFFSADMSAHSDTTRDLLTWNPTGPTLLDDLTPGSSYYR